LFSEAFVIRFATIELAFLVVLSLSWSPTPRTTVRNASEIETEKASKDARIGDVYSVVSDPRDPATFYAAATESGIFKSTDGAETWKSISAGMPPHVILRKVLVDPQESNIVYTEGPTSIFKSVDAGASWVSITSGLGEYPFLGFAINPVDPSVLYVGSGHKIFQTIDGGRTWRAITPELESGQFRLLVDPKQPRVIYAMSEGLLKSTDAGTNWKHIDLGLPKGDLGTISLSPSDSSLLYVGTDKHGIYESTNGGDNWFASNSGLLTQNLNEAEGEIPPVRAIAIDPSDANTIYAGVSANLTGGAVATIFKSTDAGEHWKLLRVIGSASGSFTVNCLTVDPFDRNVVFAGANGDGIYKSVDGGLTWSAEDAALSTANIVALSVGNSDGALYAATMEGVYRFDGQRWRQGGISSRDFRGEWVASLAVDPSNSAIVYAGTRSSGLSNDGGLFKSADGGRTWSAADSGLRHFAAWISSLAIDPSKPSHLYAGAYAYGIYRTADAGTQWVPSNSGIPRSSWSIESLVIDSLHPETLYAETPDFVWKSTNQGRRWEASKGLPPVPFATWETRLTAVAISPVNPSEMYAMGYSLPQKAATIYKSTDGGADWTSIGKVAENPVDHLLIDPLNPTTFYADNSDNGILKSVDSGRTWTPMSLGLPRPIKPPLGFESKALVTGLAMDPIHPDTIYISTSGRGVFESTDGGSSWRSEPTY
jgi:photosystem II stability/assembly factor-like uncharacterized protein